MLVGFRNRLQSSHQGTTSACGETGARTGGGHPARDGVADHLTEPRADREQAVEVDPARDTQVVEQVHPVLSGEVSSRPRREQIGRASCRERVEISVVAVSLKKKK